MITATDPNKVKREVVTHLVKCYLFQKVLTVYVTSDLSLMLGLVLALCLLTPLCDCWRLAPANCDFICCLSGLTLPLPLCVPPEEARLQRSVLTIYPEVKSFLCCLLLLKSSIVVSYYFRAKSKSDYYYHLI